MNKLKELMRNNIWTALDDYFRHADSDDVYENISEQFVERLATDSINSKQNAPSASSRIPMTKTMSTLRLQLRVHRLRARRRDLYRLYCLRPRQA